MINSESSPGNLALTPHVVMILQQIRSEDQLLYDEILQAMERKMQEPKGCEKSVDG